MKKIILFSDILGILFYVIGDSIFSYDRCFASGSCRRMYDVMGVVAPYVFLFLSLFLLSLITYKMRDEVFRAWWNFARWWVPVIILVTYLLSTQSGGGGLGIGGAMSSAFDAIILGFFYAVLVVVSLWRIVRKYRQLKREGG